MDAITVLSLSLRKGLSQQSMMMLPVRDSQSQNQKEYRGATIKADKERSTST